MQYVKVLGDTHAEAMKKLRESYGADAIIYYEKEVPAKAVFSRMFGKKQWMIQAALAEKKPPVAAPARETLKTAISALKDNPGLGADEMVHQPEIVSSGTHAGAEFLSALEKKVGQPQEGNFNLEDITIEKSVRPRSSEEPSGLSGAVKSSKTARARESSDILGDLKDIKDEIGQLKETVSIMIKNPVAEENKDGFEKLRSALAEQEFSQEFIDDFVVSLKERLPSGDWKVPGRLHLKARDLLATQIKTNHRLGSKRVIVLTGPTGVGKTTTIAKLAARLKLREGKNVALVTLDNFRIAATEQIKVYANIMDVPVHIARDPEKFRNIVDEERADLILVDTTGAAQNNTEFLEKQKPFFEGITDLEKHLVLSATSKKLDAREIIDRFQIFGLDKIILTKLDETRQLGAFAELSYRYNLPFSFFTMGQKVPDDYLPADAAYLAEKILEPWKEL